MCRYSVVCPVDIGESGVVVCPVEIGKRVATGLLVSQKDGFQGSRKWICGYAVLKFTC